MNIKHIATVDIDEAELDDLVMLFDQYMVFYQRPSAPDNYRSYLAERLQNNEASVFIAYSDTQEAAGFVLNYHTFSSVALGQILVLNDLFVAPAYRSSGVATSLIEQSIQLAKTTGAVRVDLATGIDNVSAQALYEKLGFAIDTEFFAYSLTVQ